MSMLHLRVVCPPDVRPQVVDVLTRRDGVVAVTQGGESSHGAVITADLARECADAVLADLRAAGVAGRGLVALDPIDAAFGGLVDKAERDAPGEGADALIWDELAVRIDEESTFSWTFLAFMVLATLLASIAVVTDSQVTLVGAMVMGPEFGPLAGLAIAAVNRAFGIARQAATALIVGFAVAIVVIGLFTALGRAAGLVRPSDLYGVRETEFIYHPGWFSLITALVAGAAGMLSLMSTKSAALVGVFISVTTIPAAGNAAVAGVLGQWDETWRSVAQLAINLTGIVAAGVATLAAREAVTRARAARSARAEAVT